MDSGINDTIHDCINCMPPGLKEVFYIFKMIWNIVKETKYMQEQLVTLSGALAHLLRTLGDRRHGRLGFEETDREMTELKRSVLNSCSIQYQWSLTKIAERLACSKTSGISLTHGLQLDFLNPCSTVMTILRLSSSFTYELIWPSGLST